MVAAQWGYNSFDLLDELLNVVRFEIGKQDRRSRMLVGIKKHGASLGSVETRRDLTDRWTPNFCRNIPRSQ